MKIHHRWQSLILPSVLALTVPVGGQIINEEYKVIASGGRGGDGFGAAIAMDEGIFAVGMDGDWDNGRAGSVHLYDATTGEELFKLVPNVGEARDYFGRSVALDKGLVAVGAYRDDDDGVDSGSAHVFDATTGRFIAKLRADDAAANDWFGWSVAMEDGLLAVGAIYDDDLGSKSGAVYLFDAVRGEQIGKLKPHDGAAGDMFGYSIAMNDGLLVVGAYWDDDLGDRSGSAYVFDVRTGEEIVKLLPSDGEEWDYFGYSIAIDNGVVAVGTRHGDPWGAAYTFDALSGVQFAKLVQEDSQRILFFGESIAIDQNVVAIGAPWDDDNGMYSGSAYLFDALTGIQRAKILPSDGSLEDRFGVAVAIEDGLVVGGAYWDDAKGIDSGSAYLFDARRTLLCIDLTVDQLIAGQNTTFRITKGIPGARAITVFGSEPGSSRVSGYGGYCATFGIKTNRRKLIQQLNRRFDAEGEIRVKIRIPANLAGRAVLFQSAQRGSCPRECVSNLIEGMIE